VDSGVVVFAAGRFQAGKSTQDSRRSSVAQWSGKAVRNHNRNMRRLAVYLGTYLVLVIAFFALFWLTESNERDLGAVLSKNGVVTTAKVTSSEPENHNTICFTYLVNDVAYAGCDSAHFDKLAKELPAGSSTFITYDATNPALYCGCPAEALVQNARQAPIVGALWMGTGMWAAMAIALRRWKSARGVSLRSLLNKMGN
jgi:hypothetical protein